MDANPKLGDPLPRPQYERLDLPVDQHMASWHQVLRDFDPFGISVQSRLLYHNKSSASYTKE